MTYKSGLDPENDPVVFTTEYGLEIRYASALTNSNLAGYTYFTMGEYDGKPVNWVIIGYDPSMHEYVKHVSGEAFRDNPIEGGDFMTQFETVDNSAAGSAIIRDNFAISDEAQADYEIGTGCVLCISESNLCNSSFGLNGAYNTDYSVSGLRDCIDDLYTTTLNLSEFQQSLIIPQKITNYYSSSSTINEAYFFPLAARGEEFSYQKYLLTDTTRSVGAIYYLRSGSSSGSVYAYGVSAVGVVGEYAVDNERGVRPAFVLEL